MNHLSRAPKAPTGAAFTRRSFLRSTAALATLAAIGRPAQSLLGEVAAGSTSASSSESLVKLLFESLKPEQKQQICFPWDYVDPKRGLLRTRIQNNWRITEPEVKSDFYTRDQQAMIRGIFEGITNPEWHDPFDEQLLDDIGGFGHKQGIALFGEPGSGKFEFVLTSRHMTLRCDGDSAEHVAFGGPILYAHEGENLHEKPTHPSNVFWYQALEANKLYQALDRKHRELALVIKGMPTEELVGFKGRDGHFQGCPVTEFAADQKRELQRILGILLEPFRKSDRDEVVKCLDAQGGLDQCYLAFYKEGDLGDDGVYDNWRLEGPSFVWYFRGRPHVHVWVNVADDPSPKLNAFQDSIMSGSRAPFASELTVGSCGYYLGYYDENRDPQNSRPVGRENPARDCATKRKLLGPRPARSRPRDRRARNRFCGFGRSLSRDVQRSPRPFEPRRLWT